MDTINMTNDDDYDNVDEECSDDDEKTPILDFASLDFGYKQSTSRYVYFLAVFAGVGGFLFGYDTGVISGAMIPIKRQFHLSYEVQEVVVSITLIGAIIGSSSSAYFNDRFGRRFVLLLASILFTVGSILMGIATGIAIILVGRFLVGLGIGYASMTVPIYIAEAAPSSIRGKLVAMNQLLITIGVFMAALMNSLFSYVPIHGWRYMLGVSAIPGAVMFIGFFFMPESPRWLIVNGRIDEARKVLKLLRGHCDVEEELNNISSSVGFNKSESFLETLRKIWTTKSVRRALFLGCALQAFQQLSAINTVMYYSATIIELSGVEDQTTILWMATAVASGQVIATFIATFFIEKIGRRRLMIFSILGVTIGLCLLATTFFLVEKSSDKVTFNAPASYTKSCVSYNTCYTCTEDRSCGFCYFQNGKEILKASCLAINKTNNQITHQPELCTTSLYGNVTNGAQLHWSLVTCPSSFAWLAVFAMIFYLIMFSPGVGPLPWVINAEIFPLWARSIGVATATTTNWVFNLFVSFTFLNMMELMTKPGAFIFYAVLSFIGLIFFYLFLPETKGVKLEKVEELFKNSMLVPFKKQ